MIASTSRPPSGTRPLLGAVTASVVVGSGSASVVAPARAPLAHHQSVSDAAAAAEAAALKASASADADDASADAAAATAASDLFERAPPTARLGGARAILPALADAHARGGGILCYLTTRDARAIRATSKELRAAVAAFPWADISTRVTGPLSLWRACVPRARAVNVRGRSDLCDADFAFIRGVRVVDMSGVAPAGRARGITDAAFAALAGVRELDMSFCSSPRVTGLALAYVAGVRTINLSYCNQPGIADGHFVHLRGTREIVRVCSADGLLVVPAAPPPPCLKHAPLPLPPAPVKNRCWAAAHS
jgi:hypothetical protein